MLEGIYAINPVNRKEIPIWVSDYVLMSYGTGAIMAVPAHDERDWAFAKKFGLPIVEVVAGGNVQEEAFTDIASGKLINSGFLDGLNVPEAKKAMIAWLSENGIGEAKTNYKLRDWVFSRQRYWGEPIPLVHCEKCGWVPLPESELPLTLPHTFYSYCRRRISLSQINRLGQHNLPALRRSCQKGNRYYAAMGGIFLVFYSLR